MTTTQRDSGVSGTTPNPLDGFTLRHGDLVNVGSGLQRPECILAEKNGDLWIADARGGVVRLRPDGSSEVITQSEAPSSFEDSTAATRFIDGTLPNGLAFDDNGDILISNFGTDRLELMRRTGETEVLFDTVDGQRIGKVNFVCRDSKNRVWITVSTMRHDWTKSLSPDCRDGRVLLYERGKRVRVVRDDIEFANECKLDAAEEYLYVVQTTGRNVVRFRIEDNGDLTDREVYGPQDHGRCLDGIAFDAYGNLWGTYVFTDGIYAITPDRELRMIFDDSNPDEVARMDAEFQARTITPEFLMTCGGDTATWCASITFGGPDLRTVYVGSLRQTTLPTFTSPVAGLPMVHWNESYQR